MNATGESKRMTAEQEKDLRWHLADPAVLHGGMVGAVRAALSELDDLRALAGRMRGDLLQSRSAMGQACLDYESRRPLESAVEQMRSAVRYINARIRESEHINAIAVAGHDPRPVDYRSAQDDRETIERLTRENVELRERIEVNPLAVAVDREVFKGACGANDRLTADLADLRKQKATVDTRLHEARERVKELERSNATTFGVEFDAQMKPASITWDGKRFLPESFLVNTRRCNDCGDTSTHGTLSEALETGGAHEKVCPKSPLSAVTKERDEARAALATEREIADVVRKQRDELRARAAAFEESATVFCDFCNWTAGGASRNERLSRAATHQLICSAHPMRKVEKQRDELREAIKPVVPTTTQLHEFKALGDHTSVSFPIALGDVRRLCAAYEASK